MLISPYKETCSLYDEMIVDMIYIAIYICLDFQNTFDSVPPMLDT